LEYKHNWLKSRVIGYILEQNIRDSV
jgi:hypothetical protein